MLPSRASQAPPACGSEAAASRRQTRGHTLKSSAFTRWLWTLALTTAQVRRCWRTTRAAGRGSGVHRARRSPGPPAAVPARGLRRASARARRRRADGPAARLRAAPARPRPALGRLPCRPPRRPMAWGLLWRNGRRSTAAVLHLLACGSSRNGVAARKRSQQLQHLPPQKAHWWSLSRQSRQPLPECHQPRQWRQRQRGALPLHGCCRLQPGAA
mmetsp:Transcript_93271/g.263694  ORF Transcript_93271/g.263694 Transcript_93271/m.263694 type:complete len:214 (+) Transcript_93271:1441-2082(+)